MFNFDVPSHAEDYVHRIGRTGRAGKSGRAFTIAASKDDHKYVSFIETLIGKPIPLVKVIDGSVIDAGESAVRIAAKTVDQGTKIAPKVAILADQGQKPPINRSVSEKPAKRDNKKSATGKSKPTAKIKNRNRDDELPSPPDCSGNTLAETGHVPAFLNR